MPGMEESLFSLELVVEKLYIPHVACRFPAVAFRLLDFPTILINHVEDELGKAIRRQISFDPDYNMPHQFSELKDKHGTFMVKKGKSCLFKMGADILKNHLSNTPLYVMVIDMFPEVPKLVGNSTVPLNVLMDAVSSDLVCLGPTVPSVHGDKGLFKIYNLMGKEIGYFTLGFRLLCLGPSLIPHLPEAALIQRQGKKSRAQQRENKQMTQMLQLSQEEAKQDQEEEELVETRTWGSMTEPVKHDVMMQTVEMESRGVHVDIQNPTQPTHPPQSVPLDVAKHSHHSGTQTDKKGIKAAFNAKKKVLEDLAALEEPQDEDEVIITNIVCPPPLFFNVAAKPRIEVEDDSYSLDTDMSVSDELSVESFTDEEVDVREISKPKTTNQAKDPVIIDRGQIVEPPPPTSFQNVRFNAGFLNVAKKGSPHRVRSAANVPSSVSQPSGSGGDFPILTALLNELFNIRNPGFLQGLSEIQRENIEPSPPQVSSDGQPSVSSALRPSQHPQASPSVHNASPDDPAGQNREHVKANQEVAEKDVFGRNRKSHHKCAHPAPGVPRDKSWLRVAPAMGSKKSKLIFGLTQTQRLRLQKANPGWLRTMERAEAESKRTKMKPAAVKYDSGDELNVTNFSDTLTEVRRQAQKELEKTAANDTLASVATLQSSALSKKNKSGRKKVKSAKPATLSGSRQEEVLARKANSGSRGVREGRDARYDSASAETGRVRPVPVDRRTKNIPSPGPPSTRASADPEDVGGSVRSDQASSARSRSIEVRMPSVQTNPDEASDDTISDSEEEGDLPLPDDSFSQSGRKKALDFPAYLKRSESLPESIDGQPNQSLNTTSSLDQELPLESTRNYQQGRGDNQYRYSTDDADTKQTFRSTSEAELQGLNESLDNDHGDLQLDPQKPGPKFPVVNPVMSENSPVPSTRRSVAKLELSKSLVPGIPRDVGTALAETASGADMNAPRGEKNTPQGGMNTPQGGMNTPRSSRSASPRRPLPRSKHAVPDFKKESVHTDSVSSFMPSDPDFMVSLSSGEGNYSDDFSEELAHETLERPRFIPSTKLGYTIN